VSDFFHGASRFVIAHRGLATGHPENTLPAFQAALDVGADILETDVHLSRDGEVIISHDPVLDRVAGRPGAVRDLTWRDLAEMDLGGGVGFCRLGDALEAFPTARFNIDLKTPEVVDAFVDVIRATGSVDRVLAASFDEGTRARAVSLLPGVTTSATTRHVVPALVHGLTGNLSKINSVFEGIHAIQSPLRYWGVPLVTRRFVSQVVDLGKQFHVWTINDPEHMASLYQLGVTGIVTDRADLAVTVRDAMEGSAA
jgi:glycerophosphoryl diester phosphodiesterase